MGLTAHDLAAIRTVVMDGFEALFIPQFEALEEDMRSGFANVNGRVDRLENEVRSGFANVNGRIDRLEYEVRAGFHRQDERLDTMDGRMEALENDVKELYCLTSSPDA